MSAPRIGFAKLYRAGLRQHIKDGGRADSQVAQRLGGQAATLGLGTLALARIHDQSVAALKLPSGAQGVRQKTDAFFAQAVAPIENSHQHAAKASEQMLEIRKTLRARERDLAESDRRLQRGIVQRQALEEVLKTNRDQHTELSKESSRLQERLRRLNHQVVSAQEKERGQMSAILQNEIAQTLVGIQVRLTTLKMAVSITSLHKQIASTQRLVTNSAKIMEQFAIQFGSCHGR